MNGILRYLIIVSISALALLQAKSGKNSVSPEILRLISETNVEEAREAGAIILLKESILTVDKQGRFTEVFHVAGKVLNKKALLDFAQIPILFNSYYENITIDFARSIHKDSSIFAAKTDAINIETIPQMRGGIQYTDVKALTFSLPGLEIDDAFEFQVTIRQKKQIIEREWFMDHTFSYLLRKIGPPYMPRMDSVIHSRLILRLPRGEKFQYHMTVNPQMPLKSSGKNYDEYRWEVHNVPEIIMEEGMPALDELSPSVIISSLDSWKQVHQWAKKKFKPDTIISHVIKKKAISITEGASSNEQKIERLFHFMQREIKYVSADLDRGGYTPHKPEEVLANRYGDCKDQTLLFISLLSAVDIEAYPALLNPMPYSEKIDVPTPYFSHVITFIPSDGKEFWLDTTPAVTAFPQLYFLNQNRFAFIIDGREGIFLKTPGSLPDDNKYIFDFSIARNGTRADIAMRFKGKGAASDGMKQWFITMRPEDYRASFQSLILYQYKDAILDSVSLSDVQNPGSEFSADVYFHLNDCWSGEFSSFSYWTNAKIALSLFINQAQYPHPDSKRYSYNFSFPFAISGSEMFIRPSFDLARAVFPQNDSIETKYLHLERKFNQTMPGVTAQWSMVFKQTAIPSQEYRVFYDDVNRMKTLLHWSVEFHPLSGKGVLR